MNPNPRPGPVWAFAAAAGGGLAGLILAAPVAYIPVDFIAFRSSGQLLLAGEDPYDPAGLLAREAEAGFPESQAIAIFHPPWVLPVFVPLAALPIRVGYALWAGLQFGLTVAAAGLVWRAAGGESRRVGVAAGLAVAFPATFILVGGGQMTGLALFGLAGFVAARAAGRPAFAGCLGALTALKPHLFGLFAVALLIDAARCRAGRVVVLAGATILLILTAVAVVAHPGVFDGFRAALTAPAEGARRAFVDQPAPVLGVMLRDALPGRPGWAAFAPFAGAAAGLVLVRRWLPPADRWGAGAGAALAVGSLVVAPYGGWWYDMVLLLPAIVLAAARVDRAANPRPARVGAVGFVLLAAGLLLLYADRDRLLKLYALVSPAVGLGCVGLIRRAGR
jgi:hypothetical protein